MNLGKAVRAPGADEDSPSLEAHRTRLKYGVIGAAAAVAFSAVLLLSVLLVTPATRYFAQTPSGRIVPITAFDQPMQGNQAVRGWVAKAVTETMSFGFHDWRERLGWSMRFFTNTGRDAFFDAIRSSGLLEGVESRRQVLTSAPRAMPIIIGEGPDPVSGRYRWVVQVPINMTVESGTVSSLRRFRITLAVVQVPTVEKAGGLGIDQWVTQPL